MWRDENKYDHLIRPIAQTYGVPVPIVKAIIGAESGYNPLARRAEAPRASLPPTPDFPRGGDESRGLMQVLVRTARAIGYKGPVDGLFDPATNMGAGTVLLRDNFRRAGNWDAAIAAYNAGWSKVRPNDAPRVGDAGTPFVNQAYVDRVNGYRRYFEALEPLQPPATLTAPVPTAPRSSPPLGPVGIGVLLIGLVMLLAALVRGAGR